MSEGRRGVLKKMEVNSNYNEKKQKIIHKNN